MDKHEEYTPRELGLLAGHSWAVGATPQAVAEVTEMGLIPDVVRDRILHAGMRSRIERYADSANAEDAFWRGFIHGVRASTIDDLAKITELNP